MLEKSLDARYHELLHELVRLRERLGTLPAVAAQLVAFRPTAPGAPSPTMILDAARTTAEMYLMKNPEYRDSWCQRGTRGVFDNVARKYDRMVAGVIERGEEPRIDDVVDLATYAVLQLAYAMYNRPEEVAEWMSREFRQVEDSAVL